MMNRCRLLFLFVLLVDVVPGFTQNPLIRDQFSADPTARVFGDRVYVFPSHDILATPEKGRQGWFCMEDYHVFSSANLTDWTDHGVIVTQNKVPWVRPDSYSMWAPDCVYRNGKYYFYFPSAPQDTLTYGRGFTIGVAVADKPEGPYLPQATPIKGVRGIDPNVFIDDDGKAYLYWSAGNIYGARLKDNMLELDTAVATLGTFPEKGLKEGPFVFKRNGIYYMTYPHVENKIERIEYAISDNPMGPFRFTGVIMDESPTGCWTNHHSILQFRDQWYFFYHHNDYSPGFDKARSIRADSLSFNDDNTIRKVTPTLRGIGISEAGSRLQPDRYSAIGDGARIEFLDTLNRFEGWKTVLEKPGAWIRYNMVRFTGKRTSLTARAWSPTGGTLVIRTADSKKPLAEIKLNKGNTWESYSTVVANGPTGLKDLVIELKGDGRAEIDWLTFSADTIKK